MTPEVSYDRFLDTDADTEHSSDEGIRIWLLVRPADDHVGAVALEPYELISTDAMYDAVQEAYDDWVRGLSNAEYYARLDTIYEPLFVENRTFLSDYGFYYDERTTRPVVAYFLVAACESRTRDGVYTYDDLTDEGKAFYDYVQQLYSGCTLYLATAVET